MPRNQRLDSCKNDAYKKLVCIAPFAKFGKRKSSEFSFKDNKRRPPDVTLEGGSLPPTFLTCQKFKNLEREIKSLF